MKKVTAITIITVLYALYYFDPKIPQTAPVSLTRDTLRVGTSADYPPYASINLTTGEIIGFDIDIVQEVAHRLDKKIIITNMPFNSLIFDLFAGQIDIIAAGLTPDEHRSKTVCFSRSYLDNDPLVIVSKKENPAITDLTDLYGKAVGVNTGYTSDMYISQFPQIPLTRLKSPAEGVMALQANSIYAFATSQSSLNIFLQTQKADHAYQFFTLPANADCYALAYAKSNQTLQELIDPVIDEMECDGTLEKLKIKWGI